MTHSSILLNILPVGIVQDFRIVAQENCACGIIPLQMIHKPGSHIAIGIRQHIPMSRICSSCQYLHHLICYGIIIPEERL